MINLKRINILLFSLFISNIVLANSTVNTNHFKEWKKVSLKCDVVYVGGNRSIYYHFDLPVTSRGSFKSDLLILNKSSKNKIYKINECVEVNKNFKDGLANRLEEELRVKG